MEKKIDLEKAKAERDKRETKAQDANAKADNYGSDFSKNSEADKASDEAKAAKAMKKAKSANKNLERSKDKIIDLEGDIRKLESKLESARYRVEVIEK